MPAADWTDAFLDRMREAGDPVADAVVAQLAASGELDAVNQLMRTLLDNDDPPPEHLPESVRSFLRDTALVVGPEDTWVTAGEQLFADHGPEMLTILACYALPAAYAARRGVQVLASTQLLEKQTVRRLWETTQMVVDCLAPGGLGPDGKGVRTAQRVRLMHAGVRHLCLTRPGPGWNRQQFNLPINQEDMAGTLMTFSWIVLDGLQKLGIEVPPAAQAAYLKTWAHVGRILGVDARLSPDTVAEAKWLTETIQRRQVAPSDEGRALTQALLKALDDETPGTIFDGFSDALMRLYLPRDVADFLGIPSKRVESAILWVLVPLVGSIDGAVYQNRRARGLMRRFNLAFIDWMLLKERAGTRPPFAIPRSLHEGWKQKARGELGWWDSVVMWLRRRVRGWLVHRFERRLGAA